MWHDEIVLKSWSFARYGDLSGAFGLGYFESKDGDGFGKSKKWGWHQMWDCF